MIKPYRAAPNHDNLYGHGVMTTRGAPDQEMVLDGPLSLFRLGGYARALPKVFPG